MSSPNHFLPGKVTIHLMNLSGQKIMSILMIAPRQINESYYDSPWQSNEYPNESFLAK